jgi:glutathione synthase/RimK-type ligase-like ATP-grasp enzyme
MVAGELERQGLPYARFNQRQFAQTRLDWELAGGTVTGRLAIDGTEYALEEMTGVYTRLMDDRILPELETEPAGSPLRVGCRSLHDALLRWYEVCPARVVNRAAPQGSNASKPYQAQLIARHGFDVPETLITNQPELVRDFARTHERVIYKSISGVRSIVKLLDEDGMRRLDQIRWCPVQFQAYVTGTDVRVHTIDGQVFATEIASDSADYRYDTDGAELRPVDLPDEAAQACLDLTAALDLAFAGIDLRRTPDGRFVCFEVNPSPAFSYYEGNTGQPIAAALARYLAGV